MPLASLSHVILGTSAFLLFWILAVFPSFPLLPIGRTAGALCSAALMVVFQILSPQQALLSLDLSVLSLLFGTMLVALYLEKANLFTYATHLLSWRCAGAKDLLCRLSLLTAISSALFTNDTCCLVLTDFVLHLCRQRRLPPLPFLVALASSANIGSVATPIGNPQNLIIAVESGISFAEFVRRLLPSMLLALALNTLLLLLFYWRHLSPLPLSDIESSAVDASNIVSLPSNARLDIPSSSTFFDAPASTTTTTSASLLQHQQIQKKKNASPWTPFHSGTNITISHFELLRAVRSEANLGIGGFDSGLPPVAASAPASAPDPNDVDLSALKTSSAAAASVASTASDGLQAPLLHKKPPALVRRMSELESIILSRIDSASLLRSEAATEVGKWRVVARNWAVYSVAAGMLVALLCGLNMAWTALTAAVCLMVIDFCDAGPNLEKVSYQLLVFFAGMFIAVEGFNSTGIPSAIWELVEKHAGITDAAGTLLLTLVIIILSNVASNVPTVLLLGARVAASAAEKGGVGGLTRAWMIVAWASTVAGNLTLVGSAANLIVSEQAMKAHAGSNYDLTFLAHLQFGLPSTLLIAAAGLPFIR